MTQLEAAFEQTIAPMQGRLERELERQVGCPECGAAPGRACKTDLPRNTVGHHVARIRAGEAVN